MTSKCQALDEACFNCVNARCFIRFAQFPTPSVAISDFDMALLLALANCYPTARITGCGFHFSDVSEIIIFIIVLNFVCIRIVHCLLSFVIKAILKRAMTHGLGASYRNHHPVVHKSVKMMMSLNLVDPEEVNPSLEVYYI